MTTLGNKIATARNNNLNAIRLMLALMVIASHSCILSLGADAEGDPLLRWTGQESLGSLAVDLFFLISGLLITASWLRSTSMSDYLMKRVLRIYPAFVVALFFSGAIIWTFCAEFRHKTGHDMASIASWSKSFINDCVWLQNGSLNQWTGIFAQNPYPNQANAALWTIPQEFSCYLLVLVIGLFCLFKHRTWILMATLLVFGIYAHNTLSGNDISHDFTRLFAYFLAGMSAWLWRDKIPFSDWIALACFITLSAVLLVSRGNPWFSVLLPVAGGYCIFWLGYGQTISFLDWTRKTDLSYGTYLYAFPVQQLVAMHPALRQPWMNCLVTVPSALMLAWLSWTFVEKRFLALKQSSRLDFDQGAGTPKIASQESAVGMSRELSLLPPR